MEQKFTQMAQEALSDAVQNAAALGEPIIQRQGNDRIIVELPGIQDTARAKDIIGRTATLELRMVNTSTDRKSVV